MTTTETRGASSLKVLAEAKAEGIQKSTQFRVDPRIIEIEDGFNARPIDQEHVAAMKTSMLAGSVLPPLFVRVDNDRIIMVDGHHRLTAITQLIDEGHEIKRVDVVQFRGNDADRISHMLTSAQGKPLTPLQMGLQYRKLTGFGWDEGEIAKKVGKSRQHVHDMVLLAESNSDVQGMVARGEVAAHVAVDVLRKHGSEAGNVLAGHLNTAKAAGKRKVTNKTMKKSATGTCGRNNLLSRLLSAATGELAHRFDGLCPESMESHNERDPDCPACKVLMEVDKFLATP